MEETPSHILFPETLHADLLVTGIADLSDLRKDFLFCLDFSLRGILSYAARIAWPFTSLLIPLPSSNTGIRGVLLVKSKKKETEELLLKVENVITRLSFKRIMLIPHWSDCRVKNLDQKFKTLIEEVSYRSGCNITIYGGRNG